MDIVFGYWKSFCASKSCLHGRRGNPNRHRNAMPASEDARPEVAGGHIVEDAGQEAIPPMIRRSYQDLFPYLFFGMFHETYKDDKLLIFNALETSGRPGCCPSAWTAARRRSCSSPALSWVGSCGRLLRRPSGKLPLNSTFSLWVKSKLDFTPRSLPSYHTYHFISSWCFIAMLFKS